MSQLRISLPEHPRIPPQAAREIDNFAAEVERFKSGELSPERFRAFRLAHGVYGQRQAGVQMIRVKIPTGLLNGRQLRRLADIAEEFSPTGMSHLTTRQDIQFHYIALDRVPHVLRLLAEVGLTTREACGNSVRNVTACPLTGFIADELFNVQPYALAAYAFLVRNPFCQQLARKFKIAFSACPEDCAATAIHDIGLVGRIEGQNGKARYGFQVLIGGGLGATPYAAEVLEEFVPLDALLITIKGILQVFSDQGNRRNKMKARLKFVVAKQGIEAVREQVAAAIAGMTEDERSEADLFRYVPDASISVVAEHLWGRAEVRHENGGGKPRRKAARSLLRAAGGAGRGRAAGEDRLIFGGWAANGLNKGICGEVTGAETDPGFLRWQASSVRRHRDPERAVVTVMFPLGDLEAPRLRNVAKLVTAYAEDRACIAIHQNLVLPDVPRDNLRTLYDGLLAAGLAEPGVGTALDVTCCPGADTCGLGITSSKGLTRAIRAELLPMADNGGLEAMRGVSIKISGCPNSCGQHHVGNIGFHGVVKKIQGKMVPSYQLHLGGRIGHGEARIGDALDKIPAKHVPSAVVALLRLFQRERAGSEAFADFVQRIPRETVASVLKPFVESVEPGESIDVDWGQEAPFTTDEIGVGECAGAGTDVAVNPFDNYEAEILQAALFLGREQWVDALANLGRSQYTLARILLERLGKHPESDYETACELRAQVIDRGYASDLWNVHHADIERLLRTRTPEPAAIRAVHDRARDLLEEARSTLHILEAKKNVATGADMAG